MGMRRNGFERPWHVLQVISWVVFLLLGLCFHALLLPSLASSMHRGVLAGVYWALAAPMVLFGYRMTASDPLDQHVLTARTARSAAWDPTRHGGQPAPRPYDYPLPSETEAEREMRRADPAMHVKEGERNWCPYCFEHVHPTSKHCRLCDKCVQDFDHHCKWLNTCVGGSNYHLFFTSMTFALLLLAYQLAISLFLFISTFEENYLRESAHAYIRAAYGSFDGVLLQVLLCVLVVISAPLVLSLLQLFLLHVYLWQRKITTYEWIMERRHALQLKEDEAKARAEEKQMQSGITMVSIRSNGQPTPGGPAAAQQQQQNQQQSQLQSQQPSQKGVEFHPPYVDSVRASIAQDRWAHEHTPAQHTPGGPDEAADQLATHSFARGGGAGLGGMYPSAAGAVSNAPERVSSHVSSAAGGLMHQRTITVGDVAVAGRGNLGIASRPISASRSLQLQPHDRDDPSRSYSPSPVATPATQMRVHMDYGQAAAAAAASAPGSLALHHNVPTQGLAYGGNNMDVSSVSGRHRAAAHRRPSAHMLPLSSAMAVGAAVSAAQPANAITTIHVGRSSWSRTGGSPALAPLDNASGLTSPSGVSQPLPPALTALPGLSRPGSVQLAPIPVAAKSGVGVRVDTELDASSHTPPRPTRHAHSHSIPGAVDSPSPINALSGIRSPSGMEPEATGVAGGSGVARDGSSFPLRSSSGQSTLAPLPPPSQQQPLTPTAHHHFGPASGVSALTLRPFSAASLEAEADAFLADPRATEAKLYHAPA